MQNIHEQGDEKNLIRCDHCDAAIPTDMASNSLKETTEHVCDPCLDQFMKDAIREAAEEMASSEDYLTFVGDKPNG